MDVHTSQLPADHALANQAEPADEELMMAYAHNADQGAFAILYSRHKGSLYRYCVRMLGNEALGAELFQDAWSKIIKARERYQVKAKFKTYLFHVAHNLIIDQWRKNNPEFLSVEQHSEAGHELPSEIILEEQLENEEKLEQFRNAVLQLPPQQRDVLLLHYDHGLTLEQIADLDAIGRETVKSRLRYAMQKLKQVLSSSEFHSDFSMQEVSND